MLKYRVQILLLAHWILLSSADGPTDKISRELLRKLKDEGRSDVMVECQDSPAGQARFENSLSEIQTLVSTTNTRLGPGSRGRDLTDLVNDLEEVVLQEMSTLIELLEQLGLEFKVFWIVNMILVRGVTLLEVINIAGVQIVVRIRLEEIIRQNPPKPSPSPQRPPPTGNSTWNIGLIDARCNAINKCLGNNSIIGSIDSGALWNHIELIDSWLNKPYGWWDGATKPVSEFPIDYFGHGTHTIGTMTGKTVGVAPHARWIACRAGNSSFTESAILDCADFMACPWERIEGSTNKGRKNCTVRPHVVNNSWGSRGGSQELNARLESSKYKFLLFWNALGIMPVFSMGNEGPGCGTGGSPGSFDIVLGVGAVDFTVTIAYFSSRGPAIMAQPFTRNSTAAGTCITPPSTAYSCMGDQLQNKPICIMTKPDIVAPGVEINSSFIPDTTSYLPAQGTSMSAPHVAGVIALMVCAKPEFAWNYTKSYEIITQTADTSLIDLKGVKQSAGDSYTKSSNIFCNVMIGGGCGVYPNNVFGYGLLNACEAFKAAKKLK